ncbi:MAG: acylphosphatase [Bacteroidota bacterium]
MVCYRLVISGKVQGVFYRASTKKMADSLHLSGWVQNEADGTVHAEVEGAEEKVMEMIEWCKQGPVHAIVNEVVHDQINTQGYQGFVIR